MKTLTSIVLAILATALIIGAPQAGREVKVDLNNEQVGRAPKTFQPIVGSWSVAQDGGEKVIMVDGRPSRHRTALRALTSLRADRLQAQPLQDTIYCRKIARHDLL
jgi:hypothetical protein